MHVYFFDTIIIILICTHLHVDVYCGALFHERTIRNVWIVCGVGVCANVIILFDGRPCSYM